MPEVPKMRADWEPAKDAESATLDDHRPAKAPGPDDPHEKYKARKLAELRGQSKE